MEASVAAATADFVLLLDGRVLCLCVCVRHFMISFDATILLYDHRISIILSSVAYQPCTILNDIEYTTTITHTLSLTHKQTHTCTRKYTHTRPKEIQGEGGSEKGREKA